VASTNGQIDLNTVPAWRQAGLRYHSLRYALSQRFEGRVQKVSLDAGFTCPNVDGTVALGGCVFCDNRSFSPSRRLPRGTLGDQLERGITALKRRYRVDQFIAYFQPATNTYASVERLRPLYEQAIQHPKVVGLAIGTRPDCVPDDVLHLIEEIAQQTYVSVEYGLQTIHDRSLKWMNRGHGHAASVDAIERSRGRGFEICAHIMLGLPDETHADMLATAREIARLGVDAVKLHNLYVVRNTPLADAWTAGNLQLMTREDYVRTVVDFLELLPPSMVVERTSGEAPPDYLLAPEWCLDKSQLLVELDAEFERRGAYQGWGRGG